MLQREDLAALKNSISYLQTKGKYEQVLVSSEKLLEKGTQYSLADAILAAHFSSAVASYYLGNIKKALFHIDLHHEHCLSYGTKNDWLQDYYLQYLLSSLTANFVRAQKMTEDALSIAKEVEDYQFLSISYNNLSFTLNKQKQFTYALKAAQSAVRYSNLYTSDSPILSIRASLSLIESAINLQRIDIAKTAVMCVKQIGELQMFPREKAYLALLEGCLYELLDQPQEAFRLYTEAKEIDELFHDNLFLKEIQQKRVCLAELLCPPEELYLLQKEYIELLHEIENQSLIKTAMELELRLEAPTDELNMHIDFLTGVYNRKYLEETADKWLSESKEIKQEVVCIAFDLDNLKEINDQHGHLIGDEAIKLVAETCSGIIRKDDLLGRFGGDEFVLLMRGISIEHAKMKALQISEEIKALSLQVKEKQISITVSIGLGDTLHRDVKNFKELFHLADLALYRAKQNGKNQIVSFA
ncbi:GGDEF domain-containing protein [Sporosarcina obsidiansis]|uniref:GGDEF domain-containing protein n=1 Tax=Sporosarcina obsidiansis TaxID=2660748 RepID=UPI00129BB41B|nr:GGDEF domain-containing protein [Sporosarcina obsidiansis]